ncbi:MAG TPA: GAF domain-containing protein, partial [Terriglobales bacterium]
MARETMLPADPREHRRKDDRPRPSQAPDRARGGSPATALADSHPHENLALDQKLQKIVERACLATCSTGAAIALARGNEFICCATTGATAPDLGVRLNIDSGLSAACVQTGEVQRCDDSELDPRVDAGVCRQLGIRAVLIFPIFYKDHLLGVFEVFSPTPRAFSDRDVKTLHSLSEQMLEDMGRPTAVSHTPQWSPPPAKVEVPAPAPPSRSESGPRVFVPGAEMVEPPP